MGAVFANQIRATIAFVGDGARDKFPFDFDVFDESSFILREVPQFFSTINVILLK